MAQIGPENPAAGKPPVIKTSVPSRAVPGPPTMAPKPNKDSLRLLNQESQTWTKIAPT